ncbi:MAG: YdeI/OmpD-associated family protein [Anaerolineae bacterium]|nr:YdeI/OmpD-associated family protein [Anaerolineae bacterium]
MEITETVYCPDREAWRTWLTTHHRTASEIWLVSYRKGSERPSVAYLHAVEEALCFGWIDGIAKRMDDERTAQRFTPRRPKSHWTELNKERARRLIAQGKMTEAGFAVLPDLSLDSFHIADDIEAALRADPQVWANFSAFPPLYQRIRIGFIEEVRRQPAVFAQRLAHFIRKTRDNKQFGTLE